MGLFQRISDIISANMNDWTDQFEDPERMLKQAIREMEISISDSTQQTAKALANEKTLARELERNREAASQWSQRARKAVESNDDDLARKALTRKREHEKLIDALVDQQQAAKEAGVTMRKQLDAMKAKLAEAKRSLATLSARKRAADFNKQMESLAISGSCENDDNAFAKFERLKRKVEQAEAEAEAYQELRAGPEIAVELEDFSAGDDELDVSAELAELKRKAGR